MLTGAPAQQAGDEAGPGMLAGGLYAVIPFMDPDCDYGETAPAAWCELDARVGAHDYRQGMHQWHEKHGADFRLSELLYSLAE